jgi:hypothetical protein
MIGTISGSNVAVEVGSAFGHASNAIRERLEKAVAREKQGQAATREDTFTDDLVDAMEESLKQQFAKISADATTTGDVRIEFESTKAPQGEESAFGLDLGIRVIIDTPGYSAHKAILVQCKRMRGLGSTGQYPKLRDDGETQAAKMLALTPASFFFLFNGGDLKELFKMMDSTLPFPWPEPYWPAAGRPHPFEYFDPGVTVLPATRVLALSKASKGASAKLPTAAPQVLAGSVPLGHFVAGLYASCFVGDPRTGILQLATPPTQRALVSGVNAEITQLGSLNAKRFQTIRITKTSAP